LQGPSTYRTDMSDDTTQQRILVGAKMAWSHRKWIAALAASMVTGIVGTSVAWGGYVERVSGDKDAIERIEKKLDAQIERDTARDMKQARLEEKVDAVHEDVRDFKDWKDRVTGVAETVNVPKLQGHRARKP
jgi:hypothetical protein